MFGIEVFQGIAAGPARRLRDQRFNHNPTIFGRIEICDIIIFDLYSR